MARVATTGWVSGAVAPSRLRLYHLLFMALAALAAIAIAAPSILAQRTLYSTQARVQFDPQTFPALIKDGTASQTLIDLEKQLGGVLKDDYPGLGSRLMGLDYYLTPAAPARIEVVVFTPDAGQAVSLANTAAEGLARRVYASAGTVLLRDLLGRQMQAAYEGHPTTSKEETLLRNLLLVGAVPDRVQPVQKAPRAFKDLTPVERGAVTRALEVQYELADLALRAAEGDLARGGSADAIADARARRQGAYKARVAVRLLEDYLYRTYNTIWKDPAQPGPTFVAARATSTTVIPSYNLLKLLLAGLLGLLGGLFTVLLDRSVGIATKLQELWAYRELMRNMVLRDLKARYKNSVLGYIWSLLNPLMTMLIFWFVFSLLLKNNIPMFPVFLIVALLPWNFAVSSVSGGMRAILDNAHLVKKVYFPREILPIAVVLSNLINYLLALPVMLLVMAGVQLTVLHHLQFSWSFGFLPVIVGIQIIFLIGVTLLLSTLAVFFRDTTHIVDIFLQIWIFLTPVFFTLEAVTRGNLLAAKAVRWLNPMASLVDFYRDILYGQASNPTPGFPALDGVLRTLLTALVILAIGAYVFHRNSGRFGEEL